MKKTICFVLMSVMLLTMASCSRTSTLGSEVNEETRGLDVTAVNAKNGTVIGSVALGEGECLVISPMVEQGGFTVKIAEAASDKEVLNQRMDGKAMRSFDLAPGDYTVRISVEGKTNGTMSLMPYDAAELAAQDAALEEILDGLEDLPSDLDGLDLTGGLSDITELPEVPGLGDEDYYEVATSVGRQLVEIIAFNVRACCLDSDWESLSALIRYPIEINGKTISDAEGFLQYTSGRGFTKEFTDSITAERCTDMFANSYGISMADGHIWLGQVTEDGIDTIKIISFSGIEE